MLRNMAHRSGVQVVGPDRSQERFRQQGEVDRPMAAAPAIAMPLAPPQPVDKKTVETHRFQATDVEVLAQKCTPPTETTPVSKNKPQKPTTYNAPASDDSK